MTETPSSVSTCRSRRKRRKSSTTCLWTSKGAARCAIPLTGTRELEVMKNRVMLRQGWEFHLWRSRSGTQAPSQAVEGPPDASELQARVGKVAPLPLRLRPSGLHGRRFSFVALSVASCAIWRRASGHVLRRLCRYEDNRGRSVLVIDCCCSNDHQRLRSVIAAFVS